MRYFPLEFVVVGTLISVGGNLIAAEPSERNTRIAVLLGDVVQQYEYLTDSRKDQVREIIKQVLASTDDAGPDREQFISEHFRFVAPSILGSAAKLNDERFAAVAAMFELSLRNYFVTPALSEEDRKLAESCLENLEGAVSEYVKAVYIDTPVDVQKSITEGATAQIREELKGKIGNYFFLNFLHPRLDANLEKAFLKIRTSPQSKNAAKKYNELSPILNDESIPAASRKVHVGFFVEREAFNVRVECIPAIAEHMFVLRISSEYKAPPKNLVARNNEVFEFLRTNPPDLIPLKAKTVVTTTEETKPDNSEFVSKLGLALSDDSIEIPAGAIDSPFGVPSPDVGSSNAGGVFRSRTLAVAVFFAVTVALLATCWRGFVNRNK